MTVTGTAGGGAVTAVATAISRSRHRHSARGPRGGAELLSDLVLAAVNAALDQSRDLAAKQMGQLTAGLNFPRPPLTWIV